MWGRRIRRRPNRPRPRRAAAPEGCVAAGRASMPPSAPAWSSICTMPRSRGSNCSTRRSIRCSRRSRPRSICSTAASAAARRRGCGSTPSPMSPMGRDKRIYRFVQDTRYGRKVLAENVSIPEMVEAVTKYVAQRLIERERALAETAYAADRRRRAARRLFERRRRRWRAFAAFLFGAVRRALRRWSRSAVLLPGAATASCSTSDQSLLAIRVSTIAVAGDAARDHLAAPGAALRRRCDRDCSRRDRARRGGAPMPTARRPPGCARAARRARRDWRRWSWPWITSSAP